jgi:hypothetical protein
MTIQILNKKNVSQERLKNVKEGKGGSLLEVGARLLAITWPFSCSFSRVYNITTEKLF